jgi:Na+-transporting NADH:ubiquinone oxidoreductase subunit NqrD
MARGFVCLAALVDRATRKALAHRVAITLEATHAVESLEEAFARHRQPENAFTKAVLGRGIQRGHLLCVVHVLAEKSGYSGCGLVVERGARTADRAGL